MMMMNDVPYLLHIEWIFLCHLLFAVALLPSHKRNRILQRSIFQFAFDLLLELLLLSSVPQFCVSASELWTGALLVPLFSL